MSLMATKPDTHVPILRHEKQNGTLTIYDNDVARAYLKEQQSDRETRAISLLPLLEEFKKCPNVTLAMIDYFKEILTSVQDEMRISPTILFGALSELLLKWLVKVSGDCLQDENTVREFDSKRGQAKMDYTRTLVDKVKERIMVSRPLAEDENSCFIRFYEIVEHVSGSIRIDRNDFVHPDLNIDLTRLPQTDALKVQATSFLTYYRVIISLANLVNNLHA